MPLSIPFKDNKRLLVHDYSQGEMIPIFILYGELKNLSHIKRVQWNNKKVKNFFIVDLDDIEHEHTFKNNPLIPTPNAIVRNKGKKFGVHLIWALDAPVFGNSKNGFIWTDVSRALAFFCGGDKKFTFHIGKNFLNDVDFDVTINDLDHYPLERFIPLIQANEFKEYRKELTRVTKVAVPTKKKTKTQTTSKEDEGYRNTDLFDATRKYAYIEIRRSTADRYFKENVTLFAEKFNSEYPKPLDGVEVAKVIKSILTWCLARKKALKSYKGKEGKMKLDKSIELKERQKLGAEYAAKVKVSKMELKLKVAILEMKHKGLKINASSLSKYASVNRETTIKYKHLFKA